jgi:ABC-2 type transport system ATP-binding protein
MGNKQGLNWDLTARQSFQLIRKIYDISDTDYTERLDRMSNLLNVSHVLDTQVRKLSLGERMKVELIGAILHQPKVLFLDEPTIGLDIIAKQSVRKFLRQIQREMGVTLLLTSHEMDDIENVCDRVIVNKQGREDI